MKDAIRNGQVSKRVGLIEIAHERSDPKRLQPVSPGRTSGQGHKMGLTLVASHQALAHIAASDN